MSPVLAHVGGGSFEPLQAFGVTFVAAAYALRARTLAREGRPVPGWRMVSFGAGIALILASLVSPVAHLGGELLLAHMAQHLAMADLGALLVVLGLTGPLLAPALRVRAIDRLRALTHPAIAFPLWAVNLYLWHLPALYQGALSSPALHALEHACFVGFGIAMWMPLVGPLPVPAWFGNAGRLVYVIAVRLTGTVLGNVFVWPNSVFYPDYAPGEASWSIAPLADQGVAGMIMLIEGSFVTLGLFAWLFIRAGKQGEESQGLLDLATERGVALDPARARRAVAAGQGDRLRERIGPG